MNTIDDLLADEQFHAAGSVVEVPDELDGAPGCWPPRPTSAGAPAPRWRAPELGEHTREVLAEIDLDPAITAALLATASPSLPTPDPYARRPWPTTRPCWCARTTASRVSLA